MKINLISLGGLDKKGYAFIGEKGMLWNRSMVVMRGINRNDLYSSEFKMITRSSTNIFENVLSKTKLWHMRLFHMSENRLIELGEQNLLCGDKVEKLDLCKHYVYGKSYRVKFNVELQRTKGILNYVHVDLWGHPRHFPTLVQDTTCS